MRCLTQLCLVFLARSALFAATLYVKPEPCPIHVEGTFSLCSSTGEALCVLPLSGASRQGWSSFFQNNLYFSKKNISWTPLLGFRGLTTPTLDIGGYIGCRVSHPGVQVLGGAEAEWYGNQQRHRLTLALSTFNLVDESTQSDARLWPLFDPTTKLFLFVPYDQRIQPTLNVRWKGVLNSLPWVQGELWVQPPPSGLFISKKNLCLQEFHGRVIFGGGLTLHPVGACKVSLGYNSADGCKDLLEGLAVSLSLSLDFSRALAPQFKWGRRGGAPSIRQRLGRKIEIHPEVETYYLQRPLEAKQNTTGAGAERNVVAWLNLLALYVQLHPLAQDNLCLTRVSFILNKLELLRSKMEKEQKKEWYAPKKSMHSYGRAMMLMLHSDKLKDNPLESKVFLEAVAQGTPDLLFKNRILALNNLVEETQKLSGGFLQNTDIIDDTWYTHILDLLTRVGDARNSYTSGAGLQTKLDPQFIQTLLKIGKYYPLSPPTDRPQKEKFL